MRNSYNPYFPQKKRNSHNPLVPHVIRNLDLHTSRIVATCQAVSEKNGKFACFRSKPLQERAVVCDLAANWSLRHRSGGSVRPAQRGRSEGGLPPPSTSANWSSGRKELENFLERLLPLHAKAFIRKTPLLRFSASRRRLPNMCRRFL